MVDSGKPARQMVWLLVRRRYRHTKPDAFCCGSHRADHSQRFVDRPLRARDLRGVKVAIIHIIAAKHVCDEDAVNLCAFEHLRKIYPVFNIVEFM